MSELSNILGDRIRIIRNDKGFSIEELAHRAGISTAHLGYVERGDRSPTVDMLGKIIKALGITFEEFFTNFHEPNDTTDNIEDTDDTDDTILAYLINRLNVMNSKDKKDMLIILDTMFRIINR